MAEKNTFRGKLFGGFDRKDVVSYIEKLAAERNEYKGKCAELEININELKDEMDALRAEYEEKLAAQAQEYEEKLTVAEAAVVCANLQAEEKRTEEKLAAAKLLDEIIERFDSAESDSRLICSHMLDDLKVVRKNVERLPDVLVSSKERFVEIREKLN